MDVTPDALSKHDGRGYQVLEAITHAGLEDKGTHARPSAFICIDGRTYWLKGNAQQGLVCELIAGRLASKVGAGPMCRIVRLLPSLVTGSVSASLEGVVVGSEDVAESINARDLEPFISSGEFVPAVVDPVARARVIAFQSWLGVGDSQVLVRLTDGRVFSIDHGDVFAVTDPPIEPTVIVTPIPGVADDLGKGREFVEPALTKIERVTDEEILDAISCVPAGDSWRSPVARRIEIAKCLIFRRDRLRKVMEAWLTS